MTEYRALHLDTRGRISRPGEMIHADSDEKATKAATKLLNGYDVELWQGNRRVTMIKHEK
jgi:hypothetical protein